MPNSGKKVVNLYTLYFLGPNTNKTSKTSFKCNLSKKEHINGDLKG